MKMFIKQDSNYIVIEREYEILEMHKKKNAQFKTMTILFLVTLVATFF